MVTYKIHYAYADGYTETETYYDDFEAEARFDELQDDCEIVCATLTRYTVYGGILADSETVAEFDKAYA